MHSGGHETENGKFILGMTIPNFNFLAPLVLV